MTTTATAIYEKGVLRPLTPLPLAEGARVEMTLTDRGPDRQDADFRELMARLRYVTAGRRFSREEANER